MSEKVQAQMPALQRVTKQSLHAGKPWCVVITTYNLNLEEFNV
jgi:hypothetical protein